MKLLRVVRGVMGTGFVASVLMLIVAGVVLASEGSSPQEVCVPTKASKPVLTPARGACKRGYVLSEIAKEGPEGKQGPEGKEGHEGKQGAKGERGERGERGEAGTGGVAPAFAHVTSHGEVGEDAQGFEHASVTLGVNKTTKKAETGIYCISGLEVAPVTAVATLDAAELAVEPEEAAGGPTVATIVGEEKEVCKTGTQVVIETYANHENAKREVNFETVDEGFYIQID